MTFHIELFFHLKIIFPFELIIIKSKNQFLN